MMTIATHVYVFHSCFCLKGSPWLRSISCMYQPSPLHSILKLQSSTFQYFVAFVHQVTLGTTQYNTIHHRGSLLIILNKSSLLVPPSQSSYLWWSMTLRRLQVSGHLPPHYWQPFMLCDYDFQFPLSVSRWTQPPAPALPAFRHRILPFHTAQSLISISLCSIFRRISSNIFTFRIIHANTFGVDTLDRPIFRFINKPWGCQGPGRVTESESHSSQHFTLSIIKCILSAGENILKGISPWLGTDWGHPDGFPIHRSVHTFPSNLL